MILALTLQSAALKFAPPELARPIVLALLFCQGLSGWAFYTAQVASIVRIEPEVATIALSLNASAMYLGFAIGGITGAVVLSFLDPSDLGWAGGLSVAAALATLLVRERQTRLKPLEIAG
jgi:predicted MFS family arabinose efflux permease